MKVAFVGDTCIDHYENHGDFVGGCSLNNAYWFSKKSTNYKLFSFLGNDQKGERVKHFIDDAEISHQILLTEHTTPIQEISLHDGLKTFGNFKAGLLSHIEEGPLFTKTLNNILDFNPDFIVIPVYAQTYEFTLKIIERVQAKFIFDFQTLEDFSNNEHLELIKKSDLSFFGLENNTKVIEELKDFPNTIITTGANGIYFQNTKYPVESLYPIKDSTGAGDAFLGLFMASYSKSLNVEESIIFAKNNVLPVLNQVGASIPGTLD